MLDLICIRSGSAGEHWPEAGRMFLAHRLASGPDPFGQNVTQSARIKSDPGWFCTILSRTSVEERDQVWKLETGSGLVASCQTLGPMIPAHRLASGPDVFGQTLTRPSRSDPGRFCTIWSMSSLEKWSWNGCGKSDPAYTIWPDSGCTLAITGRNQNASRSDPACLLGYLIVIWRTAFSCFFTCYLMNCCSWLDVKYQASILYTLHQHSWVSAKGIYVLYKLCICCEG